MGRPTNYYMGMMGYFAYWFFGLMSLSHGYAQIHHVLTNAHPYTRLKTTIIHQIITKAQIPSKIPHIKTITYIKSLFKTYEIQNPPTFSKHLQDVNCIAFKWFHLAKPLMVNQRTKYWQSGEGLKILFQSLL